MLSPTLGHDGVDLLSTPILDRGLRHHPSFLQLARAARSPRGRLGCSWSPGAVPIYCCEDSLNRTSCGWKQTDTCGHTCGTGVSKQVIGAVGTYATGLGTHTWDQYGRYNTRIYSCTH